MLHGTPNKAHRLKFNITGLHYYHYHYYYYTTSITITTIITFYYIALVLTIGIARHQGQNYINRPPKPFERY